LTDSLLLLARLESDVVQARTERVDVLELLTEIAEVWRTPPGETEPAIEVIGENMRLVAEGNPGDLYRLFGNLVENAVRDGGGSHIELRGSRIANRLEVSVKDDGAGIKPGEQERIFERFHRLGSKPGSGLGLSIAREIARRHGGDVSVDTAAGSGALFRVILPACAERVTHN